MSPDTACQAKIDRIWRGRTTRERADEYARQLDEHGIRPCGALRRPAGHAVRVAEPEQGDGVNSAACRGP
jgi:hypothetical protein